MKKQQYDSIGRNYVQKINPTKKYALPSTLLSLSGDVLGKTVLDLACGEGYFTRILAKQHPKKIIGVDISSEMISMAKATEAKNPLGIEYLTQDVLSLSLPEKFDIITAVYLLNYAPTVEALEKMIQSIYNHLADGGLFATITITPKLLPREEYKRGWKIVNPAGKSTFDNGDKIEIISEPTDSPPVTIQCYYWSQKVYTTCLEKVGFKNITWKNDWEISKEGRDAYDEAFWNDMQSNKSGIGIRCTK